LKLRALGSVLFFLSPVHSQMFAFGPQGGGAPREYYWSSLAVHHLFFWINLRLAIFFLPRFWQDVPKNKKTERWRERFRRWRFGKAKSKNRTRLLNQNPLFWLANREQVSSLGLMIAQIVILIGGLIFGVSGRYTGGEKMFACWVAGLVLVHLMIAFRLSMAATNRLADDRRSGALELLLGTELSIKELLRGQWMALGRQFFGPILIAAFAGVFAMALLLLVFTRNLQGGFFETIVEMFSRMFRQGARAEEGWAFAIVLSIQFMLALNWIGITASPGSACGSASAKNVPVSPCGLRSLLSWSRPGSS
jgi:hypothetical protein